MTPTLLLAPIFHSTVGQSPAKTFLIISLFFIRQCFSLQFRLLPFIQKQKKAEARNNLHVSCLCLFFLSLSPNSTPGKRYKGAQHEVNNATEFILCFSLTVSRFDLIQLFIFRKPQKVEISEVVLSFFLKQQVLTMNV